MPSCGRQPLLDDGPGARMVSAGYLYAFNPVTDIYLAGYRVINDVSSMHQTFPALNPAHPRSRVRT